MRHAAQGLIEAEGHIPGLTREDCEDRRELRSRDTSGCKREKKHHGHRYKAEDRHRLQNVEEWYEKDFGAPALRGESRIGKSKRERGDHRDQHAQAATRAVADKFPRIERNRRRLKTGERLGEPTRRLAQVYEKTENECNGDDVPAVGHKTALQN